ncbi:MAG: hypothetical protein HRT41_16045 [Campylobacteraceae bacterium]|nr:hypothetical protein [Campylobacterales bacterium]NQY25531.1 hypothetical protein [Campylobacteraceae bacterium]
MKLLVNCTVFEDDNCLQYSLGKQCEVDVIVELEDRIIIYYLDRREEDNKQPIYCYSKKDASLLWRVESLKIFKEEKLDETDQVYLRGSYKKDVTNGKKIHFTDPEYDGRYPDEDWDTIEKYTSLVKCMLIYNNKGELTEQIGDEYIMLTHFTQEEKDTLINGYEKSMAIHYHKINEPYIKYKYLILCSASSKYINFSLDPENGKLTKIIEGKEW